MTTHSQDDIIVFNTYTNIAQATSAKERLEEAGIIATIDDMDVAGMTPLAGIDVKIFSKDLAKANETLKN